MDFVSRQFIVLAKKLRKELRKSLSDVHNALQEQTRAIRDHYKREDQSIKPPIHVFAELHTPENIERARNNEDRQYRLQWWIMLGTWAAFVAVAVYAGVTYLQLRDFDTSIGIGQITAKESRIQAAASIKSANAATKDAITAERQFHLAEKALQVDVRPWIQPTFHPGPHQIDVNSNYVEPFGFVNIGKSPASNIRAKVIMKPVYNTDPFEFEYKSLLAVVEIGLLFPNSPREVPIKASGIGPDGKPRPIIITQEIKNAIEAGDAQIITYGTITYRDMLGEHWTRFCSLLTGPSPYFRRSTRTNLLKNAPGIIKPTSSLSRQSRVVQKVHVQHVYTCPPLKITYRKSQGGGDLESHPSQSAR